MKTAVAITLIISGAFLLAVPAISDHFYRAQVAQVLVERDGGSISLSPTMTGTYRFGCWLTGTAMAVAAIALSERSGRRDQR